ncbi:MAG: type II secretion system F family protein [Patescibacteria group bacterium]
MFFSYEATDKNGLLVRGRLEAESRAEVIQYLEKHDLIPITIDAEGGERTGNRASMLSFSIFETIKPVDRILLVRNLAATIKAGLNIIESLDILIADTTKNLMRKILISAKANLQKGQPLSSTFEYYKKYFPPIFSGLIRAGEASGKLDESFEELGRYLVKEYNLARKVRSALAYPMVLVVASIGVIGLLLFFVLPRLAKSFKASKAELPFLTRALVGTSNFLISHWILVLAAVIGLVWFFVYFRKTSFGRHLLTRIFLTVPVARELVKKVALVRFTRTLGSLISSGINIIEALKLSTEAVSNEVYKKAILESVDQIKNGVPLSKTLIKHQSLFPHLLINMIAVGERTGTLEQVLNTFADFYDEEVDNALKDLVTFIEPVLILFMGLIIGTIAFSILLPIYQLVGKFI